MRILRYVLLLTVLFVALGCTNTPERNTPFIALDIQYKSQTPCNVTGRSAINGEIHTWYENDCFSVEGDTTYREVSVSKFWDPYVEKDTVTVTKAVVPSTWWLVLAGIVAAGLPIGIGLGKLFAKIGEAKVLEQERIDRLVDEDDPLTM